MPINCCCIQHWPVAHESSCSLWYVSSSPALPDHALPCPAMLCCAVCAVLQDLDSDALRRELVKDHIEALKRRRADEEKRQKEAAVTAFRALLEHSSLKASSSWRKVQTKIQDTEEYEVCVGGACVCDRTDDVCVHVHRLLLCCLCTPAACTAHMLL